MQRNYSFLSRNRLAFVVRLQIHVRIFRRSWIAMPKTRRRDAGIRLHQRRRHRIQPHFHVRHAQMIPGEFPHFFRVGFVKVLPIFLRSRPRRSRKTASPPPSPQQSTFAPIFDALVPRSGIPWHHQYRRVRIILCNVIETSIVQTGIKAKWALYAKIRIKFDFLFGFVVDGTTTEGRSVR